MIIAFCWFHVKQISKYLLKTIGYLLQVFVLIGVLLRGGGKYGGGQFLPEDACLKVAKPPVDLNGFGAEAPN